MDANQLNGIIQNPALTIGAGLLGISAASAIPAHYGTTLYVENVTY